MGNKSDIILCITCLISGCVNISLTMKLVKETSLEIPKKVVDAVIDASKTAVASEKKLTLLQTPEVISYETIPTCKNKHVLKVMAKVTVASKREPGPLDIVFTYIATEGYLPTNYKPKPKTDKQPIMIEQLGLYETPILYLVGVLRKKFLDSGITDVVFSSTESGGEYEEQLRQQIESKPEWKERRVPKIRFLKMAEHQNGRAQLKGFIFQLIFGQTNTYKVGEIFGAAFLTNDSNKQIELISVVSLIEEDLSIRQNPVVWTKLPPASVYIPSIMQGALHIPISSTFLPSDGIDFLDSGRVEYEQDDTRIGVSFTLCTMDSKETEVPKATKASKLAERTYTYLASFASPFEVGQQIFAMGNHHPTIDEAYQEADEGKFVVWIQYMDRYMATRQPLTGSRVLKIYKKAIMELLKQYEVYRKQIAQLETTLKGKGHFKSLALQLLATETKTLVKDKTILHLLALRLKETSEQSALYFVARIFESLNNEERTVVEPDVAIGYFSNEVSSISCLCRNEVLNTLSKNVRSQYDPLVTLPVNLGKCIDWSDDKPAPESAPMTDAFLSMLSGAVELTSFKEDVIKKFGKFANPKKFRAPDLYVQEVGFGKSDNREFIAFEIELKRKEKTEDGSRKHFAVKLEMVDGFMKRFIENYLHETKGGVIDRVNMIYGLRTLRYSALSSQAGQGQEVIGH